MTVMVQPDEYPSVEKYARMSPTVAACLARVDVHLANARASMARAERLAEEQRLLEQAYYAAYLQRRWLFRF